MPASSRLPRVLAAGWAVLGEVWGSRQIVASLWKSETRARYANSAAGFCWAVIAPLALIAVYTVVFSALIGPRHPGTAGGFGFFLMAGMLPWLLVSQATAQAPGSLLAHGPTLRRFSLPPSLVPASVVLSALTDAAVASAIFVLALAATGRLLPMRLPAFGVAAALLVLLVFGLALAVSALNLYGRDVGQAAAAFLPIWFFSSPIAYPSEALPAPFQWLLAFNPLTAPIQLSRWSLLAAPPPSAAALVYSASFALAAFLAGAYIFQETRGDFADLL